MYFHELFNQQKNCKTQFIYKKAKTTDSSRYPSFTSIKIAEGANRYYVGKNEN